MTRPPRGQMLVMFAVVLTVLLGMVGLTIDGGFAYVHRRQMQNAADAAALDGARVFARHPSAVCANEGQARQAALDAAMHNGVVNATDVKITLTDVYGQPMGACVDKVTKGVAVSVHQPYDTYFARILGVSQIPVGANATARFGFVTEVIGAIPVVLNKDSVPANVDDRRAHPAVLSPAGGNGVGPVNFGTIDATAYGQSLDDAWAWGLKVSVTANKGCAKPPKPCKAADVNGISAGTVRAIQDRINSAPTESWDRHAPNSRRVAVLMIINGDIGNPTVIPIRFALVFLDRVQGSPANALTVHFIADSVQAPGYKIDPTIVDPPPGTPVLIQLVR